MIHVYQLPAFLNVAWHTRQPEVCAPIRTGAGAQAGSVAARGGLALDPQNSDAHLALGEPALAPLADRLIPHSAPRAGPGVSGNGSGACRPARRGGVCLPDGEARGTARAPTSAARGVGGTASDPNA